MPELKKDLHQEMIRLNREIRWDKLHFTNMCSSVVANRKFTGPLLDEIHEKQNRVTAILKLLKA